MPIIYCHLSILSISLTIQLYIVWRFLFLDHHSWFRTDFQDSWKSFLLFKSQNSCTIGVRALNCSYSIFQSKNSSKASWISSGLSLCNKLSGCSRIFLEHFLNLSSQMPPQVSIFKTCSLAISILILRSSSFWFSSKSG